MRIIPVLDVMGGRVVRAVGGRRSEYRTLVSPLSGTADVEPTARALLERTGGDTLYIADLDAIAGRQPLAQWWLPPAGTVWLDAGVRAFDDVERLPSGVMPVFGSETISDPQRLARSLFVTNRRGVLSIDLRAGRLLGGWRPSVEVSERVGGLVELFVGAGVCGTVVLLDLSAVGGGRGVGPILYYLLDQLRSPLAGVELVVGGGVRGRDDLRRLADAGADAVLAASALHDGSLP